jgi:hypothetical protein
LRVISSLSTPRSPAVWLATACAAVVLLDAGIARSGEVTAQLDYLALPECPGAADFEAIVAGRLGVSPFHANAGQRVVVRIESSGRGLEGRFEWRNEAGEWAGERTFPSRSGDCGELVRAMGFALAVQIQLLAAAASTEAPPAPPSPADKPTVVPAPPPTAITQPEPPVAAKPSGSSIVAGAGAAAGVGLTPGDVAGVGRVFGGVAWSRVAIEIGAEASLPTTDHRGDGAGFSHQLLLASVAGCGLRGRIGACVLAKAGAIRVAGEGVDLPESATGLVVQAGVRLALTQSLGRRAYLVAHGDGVMLLTRGIVRLDAIPVWTTPRVAAVFGLAFGLRFR